MVVEPSTGLQQLYQFYFEKGVAPGGSGVLSSSGRFPSSTTYPPLLRKGRRDLEPGP